MRMMLGLTMALLSMAIRPDYQVSGSSNLHPTISQPDNYAITFDSEFDGVALDYADWTPIPNDLGTYNGEQQAYEPGSVSVSGGLLHLTATDVAGVIFGQDMPYTSGLIQSHGTFCQRYGVFEIRAKMPAGQGLWPAFWLMPENLDQILPEIDIFEFLGSQVHQIHMYHHWGPNESAMQSSGIGWQGPDFTADFHIFTLVWEPDALTWYIDGVERFHQTSNVPDVPMYVIVNLAVGGTWPGNPDQTTLFPASLEVDYVRVFA